MGRDEYFPLMAADDQLDGAEAAVRSAAECVDTAFYCADTGESIPMPVDVSEARTKLEHALQLLYEVRATLRPHVEPERQRYQEEDDYWSRNG